MMQSGNVVAATEYQERAKMANWELVEVVESVCDECYNDAACNIYRRPWACDCAKCRDYDRLFRVKALCGSCMPKWLKSRDMDVE